MFENANSRENYYELLAQKIYSIKKELEDRKMKKNFPHGSPQSNMVGMPGPPQQPPFSSNFPLSSNPSVPNSGFSNTNSNMKIHEMAGMLSFVLSVGFCCC